MERIRLGIVGASAERGWGKNTHIPAIEHLSEYELTAVCTSRQESADAAASAYGARYAFADYRDLVQCPDVDAVTIAVRVPYLLTNLARRCAQAGASLRDVQRIAGHADLGTTERYVEPSLEAQRRLIALT